MCCNTKEKIALAVKELMRHKSIRKITVQDIMEATGMKRQSFYYHFQDIYDVIEWICQRELFAQTDAEREVCFEEWLKQLMETVEAERCFYKKLANEIEWKRMAEWAKESIAEQMKSFLGEKGESLEEKEFLVDFFSTTVIYYLLDFVVDSKNMTGEERNRQIALAVQTLSRFNCEGAVMAV